MARWYGAVGFAQTVETAPGVWQTEIEEHEYSGDQINLRGQYQNANQVNDDIQVNCNIEIEYLNSSGNNKNYFIF